MRSAREAAALIGKAWALRREALTGASGPEAELEVIGQVRGHLVEAVAICRETGDAPGLVVALGKLGHVESDAGRHEAARACYEEAVTLAREGGDPARLAHALRHLGDVHRRAGRLRESHACYAEALSLYDGTDTGPPPLEYANTVRPMAILKEALGETEAARGFWRRARDLYRAGGIDAGVAECEERLARLG
ncbi:MAG: tetratricopeptide repeat protein [Acidobacteria bacterium]|nr:tetratricopeptide repeat protein [Acidobacteriota bacterium]